MTWSWDATANGSVTGNGAAGPLNISINVGTTVDGRQLYSGIAIEDNGAANDRTAWTYNSVNMSDPTNRRFIQGTGFSNIAIQSYMDDSALPTTGLAHNLSATVAEADDWVMHGGLYHGLTQGAPADSDGAAAAATTITTPTMSSAADGLIVGMGSYANANAFAAVSGQTLRLDVTVDTMRGGLYDKLTAGDTTLTWTTSGASGRLAGAACSFNIPAAGGGKIPYQPLYQRAPVMAQ